MPGLPLLIQRLATLGINIEATWASRTGMHASRLRGSRPIISMSAPGTASRHNHIAVRDYLRTHPSEAIAYSTRKKQLAAQFCNGRERYGAGKTAFILSILERREFTAAAADAIRRAQPG